VAATNAAMANFSFKTIDVPAAAGTYVYISVDGVDAAGDAVGNYGNVDGDGDGTFHGLIALANGNGITLDPPGSTNTSVGITASGVLFGNYTYLNHQYGFVDNAGVFTTFDSGIGEAAPPTVPLAISTDVDGITNAGVVYGDYADYVINNGDQPGWQGFLNNNGVVTLIAYPGANVTTLASINAAGTIVGNYEIGGNTSAGWIGQGFVDSNGSFTTIDVPGAYSTSVVGISDAGVIVGNYQDSANVQHGFIDNNGVFTTITIAGATSTGVSAINPAGEIVGYYADSSGKIHGFIDEDGVIVTVDVPNATATDILGISATGEISGYYNDSSGNQHGFVGTDIPPVVSASNLTANRGQSIAASNLFSVTAGDSVPLYAFEDSTSDPSSGHFVFNGVTEPSGQYFFVPQAELSEVSFVAGAPGSTDNLAVNVFDGIDWGNGATLEVSVPADIPPVVSASNLTATKGEAIAASSLFSVTDAGGYPIAVYAFEDSTSGPSSGHFVFNGVTEPSGQYLLVSQAQLSEVSFVAGAPGSTDNLSVNVFDGTDWGNGTTLQVSVPAAIPPVVSASNVTATRGESFAASSLFSVTDAAGYPIAVYAFEDSTSGASSGHFVFNGVTEPSGQYLLVSQAQLSEVSFVAGAPGSTDNLSVNVFDGTDWGNGTTLQVSVPADIPPVISASNVTATKGESIAASRLFSVTDASGYPIAVYAFEDSTSGASSGHFVFNGVTEPSGQYLLVSQAQLSEVSFVAGAPGSTDNLSVNVFDGTDWGNGTTLQVSVPADIPPVVSAANVTATAGQSIAASNLFSVTDADGNPIAVYAFEDSTSGASSGHFVFNGVTEPSGQYLLVSQAQLSEVSFVAGAPGSTDNLSVNVFDGTDWGNGTTLQVSVPAAIPPVVTAANLTATAGQSIAASNLVSVTDADGNPIAVYAFEDSTSGASSGHFVFNGVTEPSGQYLLVSAAELSEVSFVAGAAGSVDNLAANVFDGTDWGSGATFQVSVPVVEAATIGAGSTLELTGAASGSVTFSGATGSLILDHSTAFSAQISGFTGDGILSSSDQIDLRDIGFGAGTTVSYTGTSSGGTLTVSDAEDHTAKIALAGNYTSSTFSLSSDGSGGTVVIDPPVTQDLANGQDSAGWRFNFDSGDITETVTRSTLTDNHANGTASQGSPIAAVTAGGPGNDAFIFHPGVGPNVIVNAESTDTIELDGFSSVTGTSRLAAFLNDPHTGQPQSLFQSANDGHDTMINPGHHDSVMLTNLQVADLHASNFIIH
jgi:hypothetical protein